MKKEILIWMSFLLTIIISCTKDEVNEMANTDKSTAITKAEITDILTIETDTVGQVAEKIGDHLTVQKLIISGPINATDVNAIRSLPNLVAIDMKNVTIKGGDESYTVYIDNRTETYQLVDNEIGERMFCNTQLSEIILPDNITRIRRRAFHSLRGSLEHPFTEITIPDNVKTIDDELFVGCDYLEKVVLPESLQTIAYYTFYECTNLTTVEIKGNVTTIGLRAFMNCPNLQTITLPESMTTLGEECFANTGLTSISIPNNVTYISSSTFRGCSALQSVTLPKGLTSLNNSTFYDCSALTSIILPETLQEIGDYAFNGCEALSQLDIPSSITRIGNHAFDNCKGLQTVTFNFSLNTCGIDTYAFANSGLASITLTDNVRSINSYCFQNCTSLTSVTLPNTLTQLSDRLFEECTALESIVIPDNVITIGSDCFHGCIKLSDVKLPAMLETIESDAFYECTALKEIDFTNANRLKEINSSAFYANGLVNVSLPEGLETIGSDAFSNCTNLESISVPSSVTSTEYFFRNTPKLTSVFWNTTANIGHNNEAWDNHNPNCLYYLTNGNVQIDATNVTNVIVNGESENITLTREGKFFVPQAFKAKKISFSQYVSGYEIRFLESSNWRSIVLPFTVNDITFSDNNERTLAPFNATEGDDKPFWLRRLTSNGFENVTQIEAGVPYIYALPNNSSYDSEYNFSYGTITFSAEDPNGITIPATGDMVQDAGPAFILHANYETIPMSDDIYLLNETSDENRLYGSVFVRNERDARPFEGYVTTLSTSAANAPAFFSIDGSTPRTRSAKPLGPIPSIDDM